MITPRPAESPQRSGWRANDLHLDDVRRLLDRFARSFTPGTPDQCWLWQGSRLPNGYGIVNRSYRAALLAHRVSWVAFTGRSLTDNLTIDHLCRTRLCVNPTHLEPVTLAENLRRAHKTIDGPIDRSRRVACETCGTEVRLDCLRRHVQRSHPVAA